MKQINIWFDDDEYKLVKELKDKSKLTWHDFLLLIVKHCKEANKKGDLEFRR